ncbi:hypothetical protein GCM10023205_13910 [Yinghuangia aomiensis]|uniref:Uncharacterized protein n=1 Tax=Yinghuangia aomiensis TaxID=676205 RepID=A0ABP9GUC3_9ACTN
MVCAGSVAVTTVQPAGRPGTASFRPPTSLSFAVVPGGSRSRTWLSVNHPPHRLCGDAGGDLAPPPEEHAEAAHRRAAMATHRAKVRSVRFIPECPAFPW